MGHSERENHIVFGTDLMHINEVTGSKVNICKFL